MSNASATAGPASGAINITRTRTKQFSAHHMLLRVATVAEKRASEKGQDWPSDALSAILFFVLAIESLVNFVGEWKVPNWKDFESANVNAKIQMVALTLGIQYRADAEPWATIRWLVQFRNKVVHAKPERIHTTDKVRSDAHPAEMLAPPQSSIEKEVTVRSAKRALHAAMTLQKLLQDALPMGERIQIVIETSTGTYIANPP